MILRLSALAFRLVIAAACAHSGVSHADAADGQSAQIAPEMSPEVSVVPQESSSTTAPESTVTDPEPIGDTLAVENEEPLSELAQRIAAFEHDQAKVILNARIRQVERDQHRYHPDLIEPLTLLGDAERQAGANEEALEAYNRAVHIDRVNNGLHSPAQIDVVYKEADAWMALGNISEANNRHEYAYEVQRRRHEPTSLELLEPTYRLADWYSNHFKILPARELYQQALTILENNELGEHPGAIRPLRNIARTYRLERFPPVYLRNPDEASAFSLDETDRPVTPGLTAPTHTINQFPRGERALGRIIKILSDDPSTPPSELADAFVELADWNLLFGYPRRAHPLYQHAYQLLTDGGLDANARFATPEALYFPAPPNPSPPPPKQRGELSQGLVTVSFSVNRSGEVQSLETVSSEPEGQMVFRVRRSMRISLYRPRIIDGVPVIAEEQSYTHTYPYFPRLAATPEPMAAPGYKDPKEDSDNEREEPDAVEQTEPSAADEPTQPAEADPVAS